MKAKKKSKFLTFCFSLFPGAGEMYMGFMRMGLSLMLLFFLLIFIPVSLRLGSFSTLALVVWFYGFFHANHLAGLSDEEFSQVKDEYLFGAELLTNGKDVALKYHKWVAAALIAAGVLLLWNTLTDMAHRRLPDFIYTAMNTIGNYAPRILVAVFIIFIGVKMIAGRKQQLAESISPAENTDSSGMQGTAAGEGNGKETDHMSDREA